MKTKALMAAVAAAGIAAPATAQPVKPIYDPPPQPAYEEPQEYRDRSDEFREAFRRGCERGFERGEVGFGQRAPHDLPELLVLTR